MTLLRALCAFIATVALALPSAAANVAHFFPEHAKGGELWALIQANNVQLFQLQAPELWFTQQLDHFAHHNNKTFQQRYYEVNTFWKQPNGPVILYIGGEGELKNAPQGFVQDLAKKFGAKILALEHRFYGHSIPQNDLSVKNLKYLAVEQALADLKHFKESYQAANMPEGAQNKWIAIGGSYPGALSAWFRIAYPNTTVASLSSSGVVQPIYEFDGFDQQVAESVGADCAEALRATTKAFEKELQEGSGTNVKALFGAENLCDGDFFYMLADSAAMAVQYGHKDKLCNQMVPAYQNNASLTETFADFTNQYYGKDFGSGCFYDTTCLRDDQARWGDSRSWRWQKCFQLAYFQIAPKENSLRSSIVNIDYHEMQCKAIFGANVVNPSKGVKDITKKYGGNHPHGHKIFFSNGYDDPWQRASVVETLSDDQIANLAKCDLCGHCGDLGSDSPSTPAPLRAQREEIVKYLSQWLEIQQDEEQVEQEPVVMMQQAVSKEPGESYRSSPLVLVPILFAFVVLVVVLHSDAVRDATTQAGYQRIETTAQA